MEQAALWKIGFGTILSLFVLVGLFRFKNALRHRLFPRSDGKARGEAMAALLSLQARLQGEMENPTVSEVGEGGEGGKVQDLGQEPER